MYNSPGMKYCTDVVDRKITACENIIHACQRHLEDLNKRDGKDLLWLPERAQDVKTFFRECCTVSDPNTQQIVPLELLPWQHFLIDSLFGWVVKEDKKTKRKPGTRRFRKLMLTSAKTSGKSAMMAALDLYLVCRDHYIDLDGEAHWIHKPYVIVSSSKKEQAIQIGLGVSADMVRNSPVLSSGCEVLGGNNPYCVVVPSTAGRLEAITHRAGVTGVGGLLVHALHVEEVSEDRNRDRWDALLAALKMSPQPLVMLATNPAPQMSGIAYDEYKQACQAARGDREFDHVLGMVYALDEEHVPESVIGVKRWYPPRRVWEHANPSLPFGMPPESYLHTRIKNAVTTKQKREVLRLNYGVWSDDRTDFIGRDEWLPCEVEKIDENDMKGKPLWVGLDLATTNDFTAIAMLWGDEDECYLKVEAYTGLQDLHARAQESSGDLESWRDEGFILGNDDRTLDFSIVANRIWQLHKDHELQAVVMDIHRRGDWDRTMDAIGMPYRYETDKDWGAMEGILMISHPQGFRKGPSGLLMDTSMEAMEECVYKRTLTAERNPVMHWGLESIIIRHNDQMERKCTKRDAANASRAKIDVVIATIQAFGLMRRGLVEPEGKTPDPWSNPNFDLAQLQRQAVSGSPI